MTKSPFLLSISQDMRQKGYSLRTEKKYLHWVKRFILFHGKRHPNSMGGEEVRQFLSHLANSEHVAINTQKIALNALAFLYNKFLNMPLGDLDFVPASKPRYLPTVLSVAEVQKILQCVESLRNKVIFHYSMARAYASASVCGCVLKTLILIWVVFKYRMGKAINIVLRCCPLVTGWTQYTHSSRVTWPHRVSTTQIYTHVLGQQFAGTHSPLDMF